MNIQWCCKFCGNWNFFNTDRCSKCSSERFMNSNKIVAKRAKIITKNGRVTIYTHVTDIYTLPFRKLKINGERDDKLGMRINAEDNYFIGDLLTLDVEWYIPTD